LCPRTRTPITQRPCRVCRCGLFGHRPRGASARGGARPSSAVPSRRCSCPRPGRWRKQSVKVFAPNKEPAARLVVRLDGRKQASANPAPDAYGMPMAEFSDRVNSEELSQGCPLVIRHVLRLSRVSAGVVHRWSSSNTAEYDTCNVSGPLTTLAIPHRGRSHRRARALVGDGQTRLLRLRAGRCLRGTYSVPAGIGTGGRADTGTRREGRGAAAAHRDSAPASRSVPRRPQP